jgi:LysR family transcriptional regulator, nitrogen assimilation regulatory protein
MDLRQLRYFLHTAKTQNLTHASSKAWISQSALSRQIKSLEADLGVTLFERQARGLRLTEAGATLARSAAQLLQDIDEIRRSVGRAHQEPTGVLRIGTPTSLRGVLVAPWLAQFHGLHPAVRLSHVEGTSKEMRDALLEGDLDLAVVIATESLASCVVAPLLSEAMCWVGPARAALSPQQPVHLKRVAQQPLILTGYPNSLRLLVDRALADAGLQVQPVLEANTASMALDLVRAGVGYTVLPSSALHSPQEALGLSVSPIRTLRVNWAVARASGRAPTRAVQLAVEMVQALCASRLHDGGWWSARAAAAARA